MSSRLVLASILTLCFTYLSGSSALAQAQAAATQAQATPPAGPVFDVAAIHQHIPEPHEHNSIWSSPFDGHFKAQNMNLIMLMRWAFEIPETRILGEPGWSKSAMFNIDAEASGSVDAQLHNLTSDAGRQQKEKMVQALLAERFKLVTHTETRELPIYVLVVAKGGPKLGAIRDEGTTIDHGRDHIEVQGSDSVALLAEELSKVVGRDVVDKTDIPGRYDLKLQWTPDDASGSTESGPSIFTALQEQLGLKLESEKGPVSVLLIDHAEMPSEN